MGNAYYFLASEAWQRSPDEPLDQPGTPMPVCASRHRVIHQYPDDRPAIIESESPAAADWLINVEKADLARAVIESHEKWWAEHSEDAPEWIESTNG